MLSSIVQNPAYLLVSHYRTNQINLNESLERLASGLRVRSPSDDILAYVKAEGYERSINSAT